jgi:transposase-like protein
MAKKLEAGKAIKPKRKCCKSRPRCKRCGVTLDRLSKQGLAKRRDDGRYVIVAVVPKRELKAARRR